MTRDRTAPIESFGPELLAALLSATTEHVPVKLPYNKAVRLRQRLYQLRYAMKKAKHEKYVLVSRVRITISWPDDTLLELAGEHHVPKDKRTPCEMLLSPNDSEFNTYLQKAGVDIGLAADPITELTPTPTYDGKSELDALEALLGDIK